MMKMIRCKDDDQSRIRFVRRWTLYCTSPKGCRLFASLGDFASCFRRTLTGYNCNLKLHTWGHIGVIARKCRHKQWQCKVSAEHSMGILVRSRNFAVLPTRVAIRHSFVVRHQPQPHCDIPGGWVVSTFGSEVFLSMDHHPKFCYNSYLCRATLAKSALSISTSSIIQHVHYHPTDGCRIGEAKNPGPVSQGFLLKCCLLNPTAIYNKVDIITRFDSQIFQIAETSATAAIQIATQPEFKSKGFQTHWSPAVAAHGGVALEETSYRGQATGVSIHSQHPLRPSRVKLPDDIDHTRILSSIVQIGEWKIHFVTVYGYPSCHPKSKDRTNNLLEVAADIVTQINLPAIISGDFNHPLETLGAGQTLARCGYINLKQKFQELYSEQMPFTCREVTSPDQVLISPLLQDFVTSINVDKQKDFSDHDPILYQLKLPIQPPMISVLRLPKTWLTFQPDPILLEKHFVTFAKLNNLPFTSECATTIDSLPDALELWAKVTESAVDATIKEQHANDPVKFPQRSLPKNCRGRAQLKTPKKKPFGDAISSACHGQYDPPGEAVNIQLKLVVRQTRRVQSLYYRMTKLALQSQIQETQLEQIHFEWAAISKAKGFGRSFPHWCCQVPELIPFPIVLPTVDYLLDLSQFLKLHADQMSNDLQQFRAAKSKFGRHNYDVPTERSKISKHIKGSQFPMVESLQTSITSDILDIRTMQGLLEIDVPGDQQFRLDTMIKVGDAECDPIDQNANTITLIQRDADQEIQPNSQATQIQWIHEPYQVASALNQYWDQFWNRDKNEPPDWTDFNNLLDETPALDSVEVTVDDPKLWKQAALMMKSRSARGIDGFLVDELKALPDSAFNTLAQIFSRTPAQSFGKNLSQVITLPLAKNEDPSKPSQTRPITLVAILYRLWAKTTTMQILHQWKNKIPDYIIGFLPGRSPEIEMIKQQHLFEKSHADISTHNLIWQGVTLDLIKCFNLIGRFPAAQALKKSGIPPHLVDTWLATLQDQTRLWKVNNNVYSFEHTSTGTPEGDSWSVLACVAISRVWAHRIETIGATPACYADNWSFKSLQTDLIESAIHNTIICARAFKLLIDWAKTWCWRTSSRGKAAWKQRMQAILPHDVHLQIVAAARELGYTMAYNKVQSRQTQRQRHDEAIRRIHRLRKTKASLQIRAQLCADACLSKALFATATYHVGNPWIKELRTLIAKTLVPDRKNSNPFLATQLLSSFVRDPELHLILDCIRCIRRFLYSVSPSEQLQFFEFAAKHTGTYHEVFGPAGALRSNLLRIGWQIDKFGWLLTDSRVKFHLLQDNLPDIIRFVEHCWMKHVMQCRITRQHWQHFPVPDRPSTLRIFDRFPPNQQQVLATQITGAYMLGDQRSHIEDASETCALCSHHEDIRHRMLTCSELQHVRGQHAEIVDFLHDHHDCHLYLPVIYQHSDFEFDTWFFRQLPPPQLQEEVLSQVSQEISIGYVPTFWTDGSCNNPTKHCFKRAAFGIVFHPYVTAKDATDIVSRYQTQLKIPHSFQVLGSGPCQGHQSVPRAEMQAVLALIENVETAIIYTDSQYVVDQTAKLGVALDIAKFHRCPNFDLLVKLWRKLQTGDFRIYKVKAHDIQPLTDSFWETFYKLGNEAADRVANIARTNFQQKCPVPKDDAEMDDNLVLSRSLAYRYDLQVERTKLLAAKNQANKPLYASKTFQEQLQKLNPHVEEPWKFETEPNDFLAVRSCLWGTQYSIQILKWLETLEWPAETDEASVGITWYELACNFIMVTQSGLVINTGGTGRDFLPRRLCATSTEVIFSRQVFSFERAITNIQAIIQRPILPMQRTIATSVRFLGLPVGKSGLARRPAMQFQSELAEVLIAHFAKGDIPPEVPLLPLKTAIVVVPKQQDDEEHSKDWTRRIQLHNRDRKRRR